MWKSSNTATCLWKQKSGDMYSSKQLSASITLLLLCVYFPCLDTLACFFSGKTTAVLLYCTSVLGRAYTLATRTCMTCTTPSIDGIHGHQLTRSKHFSRSMSCPTTPSRLPAAPASVRNSDRTSSSSARPAGVAISLCKGALSTKTSTC